MNGEDTPPLFNNERLFMMQFIESCHFFVYRTPVLNWLIVILFFLHFYFNTSLVFLHKTEKIIDFTKTETSTTSDILCYIASFLPSSPNIAEVHLTQIFGLTSIMFIVFYIVLLFLVDSVKVPFAKFCFCCLWGYLMPIFSFFFCNIFNRSNYKCTQMNDFDQYASAGFICQIFLCIFFSVSAIINSSTPLIINSPMFPKSEVHCYVMFLYFVLILNLNNFSENLNDFNIDNNTSDKIKKEIVKMFNQYKAMLYARTVLSVLISFFIIIFPPYFSRFINFLLLTGTIYAAICPTMSLYYGNECFYALLAAVVVSFLVFYIIYYFMIIYDYWNFKNNRFLNKFGHKRKKIKHIKSLMNKKYIHLIERMRFIGRTKESKELIENFDLSKLKGRKFSKKYNNVSYREFIRISVELNTNNCDVILEIFKKKTQTIDECYFLWSAQNFMNLKIGEISEADLFIVKKIQDDCNFLYKEFWHRVWLSDTSSLMRLATELGSNSKTLEIYLDEQLDKCPKLVQIIDKQIRKKIRERREKTLFQRIRENNSIFEWVLIGVFIFLAFCLILILIINFQIRNIFDYFFHFEKTMISFYSVFSNYYHSNNTGIFLSELTNNLEIIQRIIGSSLEKNSFYNLFFYSERDDNLDDYYLNYFNKIKVNKKPQNSEIKRQIYNNNKYEINSNEKLENNEVDFQRYYNYLHNIKEFQQSTEYGIQNGYRSLNDSKKNINSVFNEENDSKGKDFLSLIFRETTFEGDLNDFIKCSSLNNNSEFFGNCFSENEQILNTLESIMSNYTIFMISTQGKVTSVVYQIIILGTSLICVLCCVICATSFIRISIKIPRFFMHFLKVPKSAVLKMAKFDIKNDTLNEMPSRYTPTKIIRYLKWTTATHFGFFVFSILMYFVVLIALGKSEKDYEEYLLRVNNIRLIQKIPISLIKSINEYMKTQNKDKFLELLHETTKVIDQISHTSWLYYKVPENIIIFLSESFFSSSFIPKKKDLSVLLDATNIILLEDALEYVNINRTYEMRFVIIFFFFILIFSNSIFFVRNLFEIMVAELKMSEILLKRAIDAKYMGNNRGRNDYIFHFSENIRNNEQLSENVLNEIETENGNEMCDEASNENVSLDEPEPFTQGDLDRMNDDSRHDNIEAEVNDTLNYNPQKDLSILENTNMFDSKDNGNTDNNYNHRKNNSNDSESDRSENGTNASNNNVESDYLNSSSIFTKNQRTKKKNSKRRNTELSRRSSSISSSNSDDFDELSTSSSSDNVPFPSNEKIKRKRRKNLTSKHTLKLARAISPSDFPIILFVVDPNLIVLFATTLSTEKYSISVGSTLGIGECAKNLNMDLIIGIKSKVKEFANYKVSITSDTLTSMNLPIDANHETVIMKAHYLIKKSEKKKNGSFELRNVAICFEDNEYKNEKMKNNYLEMFYNVFPSFVPSDAVLPIEYPPKLKSFMLIVISFSQYDFNNNSTTNNIRNTNVNVGNINDANDNSVNTNNVDIHFNEEANDEYLKFYKYRSELSSALTRSIDPANFCKVRETADIFVVSLNREQTSFTVWKTLEACSALARELMSIVKKVGEKYQIPASEPKAMLFKCKEPAWFIPAAKEAFVDWTTDVLLQAEMYARLGRENTVNYSTQRKEMKVPNTTKLKSCRTPNGEPVEIFIVV